MQDVQCRESILVYLLFQKESCTMIKTLPLRDMLHYVQMKPSNQIIATSLFITIIGHLQVVTAVTQ